MKEQFAAPVFRGRYSLYVLLAVWAIAVTALLSVLFDRDSEQAMRVLSIAGFTVVTMFATFAWFLFFSRWTRKIRLATLGLFAIAFVALGSTIRVQGFTGGMLPTFRFAWQTAPDRQLSPPTPAQESSANVDLLTTTRFDSPQFLGPHRDASIEGLRLDPNWDERPPELLWRQPIGAGWSSFSAVNGFAVTMEQRGDQELTTCYEVTTGELRWASPVSSRHETVLGGIGPRATPTIDEGRVYSLGATGILRCLNGDDGAEVWRHDLIGEFGGAPTDDGRGIAWGRAGSPLIVNQTIFVPVGGPATKDKVSLIAYDKATGQEIWRAGEYQISYASPGFATLHGIPQILCVLESWVCSFNPDDGSILWKHEWPGQSTAMANASQAVPIDGDRVFLSKGYGQGCELLRIEFDPPTGWQVKSEWRKKPLMKTKFTNVSVFGDYVYGLDDIILECIDLRSGGKKWKAGRYGHGQLLRVGTELLIQTEDGRLALVSAAPDRYVELGRFDALTGKTWNVPCLYGRYLLVRNDQEAACYELGVLD